MSHFVRAAHLLAIFLSSMIPLLAQAPGFEGRWLGILNVGPNKLRIALRFEPTPTGRFSVVMNSLDQNPADIRAQRVAMDGRTATIEFPQIGATIEGTLSEDGSTINATLRQSGASLPITFSRGEAEPPRRSQEPKKPYPYDALEVSYENAGVRLAATLTLPRSQGPHPAVLLLSGSGAQDRDETIMGHRPFLVLADYLTRRGIAVLRADDRGVGGSTGNPATSTLNDLAGDALAGIAYLKSRKEIDPARIGIIGHSQGGLVGAIAASNSPDVAFLVSMAGTGLPGDHIVLRQVETLSRSAGVSPEMTAEALAVQRKLFEILKTETDDGAAVRKMLAELPEPARRAKEAELRVMTSRAYRSLITTDPAPVLAKVRIPVLAINGELDTQVAADENLSAIAAALAKGGNKNVTTVKLPGLNHLFQRAETGAVSEYRHIEETINPAALKTIGDWIAARVQR
ncbi:MAG: alpha/beta hydrolase family protein [Rhodospirillales bacterium]